MLEPKFARFSGIQFQEPPKLQGPFPSDSFAVNLNNLIARLDASGLGERTDGHLCHENFCNEWVEEKTFTLHLSDKAEFLFRRVAGMRENEQQDDGDSDPFGSLKEHRRSAADEGARRSE